MLKDYYPPVEKANRYVYLSSLNEDNPTMAAAASQLLQVNPDSDFDETFRLEEAIQFLKACAQNEREKEQNFIKTEISPEYSTDSIEGIIKAINEKILGAEEFQRRIQTEIDRYKTKGTGGWSATQAYATYINSALEQVYGVTQEKTTANPSRMASVTRTIILNEVFKILGPYGITANEGATIAGLLQSQITPFLLEKLDEGEDLYTDKTKKISKPKLEKLIKSTREYKSMLGGLRKDTKNSIDRVSKMREEASKILQGFLGEKNLKAETEQIKTLSKIQETKYLNMLTQGLEAQIDASVLKYKISGNRGHGGEFRVLNDLGIMVASSLGSSGGKTDVRRFTIPAGELEVKLQKNPKLKALKKQMENITNTQTQSLFTERGRQFEELYIQMSQEVEEAQKNLEKKDKLFIEHYSVKDYVSANDASRTFEGFNGVENMKMLDFLNAIQGLATVGFTMVDIDWLATCLVNTAEAALGASNLSSLERNLSIFTTMLLFDDGLTIAKMYYNNPYPAVQALHIFPLNGIYVPSSVVMEEIANQLENSIDDMRKASNITIFPGDVDFREKLDDLTEQKVFNYHRWDAIRDIQIQNMSIRIKFLANFFDIIERIGG